MMSPRARAQCGAVMKPYWMLPVLAVAACATHPQQQAAAPPPPPPPPCEEVGLASWYHAAHRVTATGDVPRAGALVAAHRTLPMGTHVRVTAMDTGQSVQVRIDDRGPFRRDRVIDLSAAAAKQLGIRNAGLAQVMLQIDPDTDGVCPLHQDSAT